MKPQCGVRVFSTSLCPRGARRMAPRHEMKTDMMKHQGCRGPKTTQDEQTTGHSFNVCTLLVEICRVDVAQYNEQASWGPLQL